MVVLMIIANSNTMTIATLDVSANYLLDEAAPVAFWVLVRRLAMESTIANVDISSNLINMQVSDALFQSQDKATSFVDGLNSLRMHRCGIYNAVLGRIASLIPATAVPPVLLDLDLSTRQSRVSSNRIGAAAGGPKSCSPVASFSNDSLSFRNASDWSGGCSSLS
jgi:hypothetical protein